jgi:LysM repeat protein/adenylate kinase
MYNTALLSLILLLIFLTSCSQKQTIFNLPSRDTVAQDTHENQQTQVYRSLKHIEQPPEDNSQGVSKTASNESPEATRNSRKYIGQGIDALEEGEEEKARSAFRSVLHVDPGNKTALKFLQQMDTNPENILGNEAFYHTVQPGDSLVTIAQRYLHDPLQFYILAKYNGISNPSRITIGQKIKIPSTMKESSAPLDEPQTPRTSQPNREAQAQSSAQKAQRQEQSQPTDLSPPRITLLEPVGLRNAAGVKVGEETIVVSGTAIDETSVWNFFVNDQPVSIDTKGHFSHRLRLAFGENVLRLAAIDVHGNKAVSTYTIMREEIADVAKGVTRDLDFGHYHALVIGNNNYEHLPKLRTAVTDATAVADLLRQHYNFGVTLLRNASRKEVIVALDKLRASLLERDNLLIYYAGHGILDNEAERGYWLPVDAHKDIRANWISVTDITDTLKALTAKHVLVVADSCYSGTLVRNVDTAGLKTGTAREVYWARMVQKRSRTALTSGGVEPVLDGSGGSHSVFAKAFLTILSENRDILEGQQLFASIRPLVMVNSPQTPEYANIRFAGHEGGDFLFVPKD